MSEGSRLGREQIQTAFLLQQIVDAGVRVFYYLDDRESTINTSMDKVLLPLPAFAAETEREKASQRTYDALLHKAKAGHVTGGRVYGCDNVAIPAPDGRRAYVNRQINPMQAPVSRRIFEMYADGAGMYTIPHPEGAAGRRRAFARFCIATCIRVSSSGIAARRSCGAARGASDGDPTRTGCVSMHQSYASSRPSSGRECRPALDGRRHCTRGTGMAGFRVSQSIPMSRSIC